MIAEQHVRAIALFFLFAFLDERIAVQAAEKTVATLKVLSKGGSAFDDATVRCHLIQACKKSFDRYKKRAARERVDLLLGKLWRLPENIDLVRWKRFHKEADEDEMIAVILTKILGFAEIEVATALQASLGTVRHRIARGVRDLGSTSSAERPL